MKFFTLIHFLIITLSISILAVSAESSETIEELFSKAMEQIDEGRFDDALIYLDSILELDPNQLAALSNKGGVLIELEKYEEAIEYLDRALEISRDPYGNVKDAATGETVVGAKITVFTENGSIVALDKASNPTASNPQMTDATGRFGFNLRADRKYYMVASAPGYEDYQSNVFTEQFHVIREDIKMVPAQEQMASNIE